MKNAMKKVERKLKDRRERRRKQVNPIWVKG